MFIDWMRWWPSSVVSGILFKAIISCTDIYSASISSGVWPHCQVPWPAIFFLLFHEEYRVVSRPYSVLLFPHCFTTISIAAKEPSVEHARVVLHTSPALGWFWPVRACLSHSVYCSRNVPFVSSFSRRSCSRDVSNGTKQGDADAGAECCLFYCACSRRKVCYFFTEWLLLCYNFIKWTTPILFLIVECRRTTAKTRDMAVQSVQSRHSVFSSPSILLQVSGLFLRHVIIRCWNVKQSWRGWHLRLTNTPCPSVNWGRMHSCMLESKENWVYSHINIIKIPFDSTYASRAHTCAAGQLEWTGTTWIPSVAEPYGPSWKEPGVS